MAQIYPSTRVLFDRKHQATRTKVGLVQLEILYLRRRKYVSTGVKVFAGQWSDRDHVINRPDLISLNKRIDAQKARIDEYVNGLIEQGDAFDFAAFDRWLAVQEEKRVTFLEWLEDIITTRPDIRESTRKTHRKLVSRLREFGRIVFFGDLSKSNIMRFDDYLHEKGIRQTTIFSYHKELKTYILEAMRRELLDANPYLTIKIERGKSEWGKFLEPEELERIECATMPTQSLDRVRDLFLFQCYTGLAYADLMSFDIARVHIYNGMHVYSGGRLKTDIQFTTVLTEKALAILEKYGNSLPAITNQQYNLRLKVLADAAGIDKPIASHYGRRTCGMVLLNEGFPIEVVAKVLGHASIKTTQEAYARILDKTVAREFARRRR